MKFENLKLKIQITIAILCTSLILLTIPILSYMTGWEIIQNKDIANWITVIIALPIGISITLVFYIITKYNTHKRKIRAAETLSSISIYLTPVFEVIEKQGETEKLKSLKDPTLIKSHGESIKTMNDIVVANLDVLHSVSLEVNAIVLTWEGMNAYIETIGYDKDILAMYKSIQEYLSKLNGKLRLIIGDDDYNLHKKYAENVVKMRLEGQTMEELYKDMGSFLN